MAKRQLTANKPTAIRSPQQPRAQQRELEQLIAHMINVMSKRFRNQVFNELHKSTINKFADAQPGNYAKVFLGLANRVRRKMVKQFDDARIEELVATVLNKANRHNRDELYKLVEKRVGISTKELTATEGLTFQINALVLETAQWVKKLRDETLEGFTANSLRAMSHGSSLEEIMQQFDGLVEKRKNHARMVARSQIGNFNSVTTKIRAQNLGITRARWVTAHDERVRGRPGGKYPNAKPNHWELHGKEFDLDEGVKTNTGKYLLPGVDYQCRCDYELIIPGADD